MTNFDRNRKRTGGFDDPQSYLDVVAELPEMLAAEQIISQLGHELMSLSEEVADIFTITTAPISYEEIAFIAPTICVQEPLKPLTPKLDNLLIIWDVVATAQKAIITSRRSCTKLLLRDGFTTPFAFAFSKHLGEELLKLKTLVMPEVAAGFSRLIGREGDIVAMYQHALATSFVVQLCELEDIVGFVSDFIFILNLAGDTWLQFCIPGCEAALKVTCQGGYYTLKVYAKDGTQRELNVTKLHNLLDENFPGSLEEPSLEAIETVIGQKI
jgi:hypothetical protein